MEITNKHNLPETILRANRKRNSEYDKGKVNRSATQLVSPPRIDILRKKHFADITIDITDDFWPLLGSALHQVLQWGAGPNTTVEERLFGEVDGWLISGAIDVQEYNPNTDTIHLYDYKLTAAYSVNGDVKDEWVKQLNIYAYLVRLVKKINVDGLTIVAVIRDWNRHMAKADPLYPQAAIIKISVPVWSNEEQESYVRERVDLHRRAEMAFDIGVDLPNCSKEEQWERGAKWVIIKTGGKKPSKVCSSEKEAQDILSTMSGDYSIEFRPGKPARCEGNYCQVAGWCSQYRQEKQDQDVQGPS